MKNYRKNNFYLITKLKTFTNANISETMEISAV